MHFPQSLCRWSRIALPLILLLLLASLVYHGRAPVEQAAGPSPATLPPELATLLGGERRPLGTARELPLSAQDEARMEKLRTAIAAFAKGRADGTLAATPRRVAIPPPGSRGPSQSPEALLSDPQRRALSDLRWRAEKSVAVRVVPEDRSIRLLSGRRLEEPAAEADPGLTLSATTARRFLRRNADLFALKNPEEELRIVKQETDALGITHVRMRQQWRGVEVWPADAMVQMDKHGAVTLFMGTYRPIPEDIEITPAVTAEDGRTLARRAVREASGQPVPGVIQEETLVFYAPDRAAAPRLAWQHRIHGSMMTDWESFIDARTGEVIVTTRTACTAAATGTGADLYGNTQTVQLWQDAGKYWMVDTTKQMFKAGQSTPPSAARMTGAITLHDAKGISEAQYYEISQPNTAIEQISNTGNTGGFNADAISASVDVAKVYDWLLARHGRSSYDGNGANVTVVVNIDYANASFNWGTGTMSFGLRRLDGGAGREYYARAFDVTAHEMAHGVTGTTAGLIYEFQPGALNEAFSDVLGETAEAMVYRNGVADWVSGANLTGPIRDMRNPGAYQQPGKMSEFQNLDRSQDNGGVHVNSGIVNRAFYQLAEGLNPGIGLDKAEMIFYRALTGGKLQRNSQFIDCRLACVAAAVELHGSGSPEAQKTGAAFDVVEIFDQQAPPPPPSLPATTGSDSVLFSFPDFTGYYLGRREIGLDPADGSYLNVFATVQPFTRPAVKGDGSEAFAVLSNLDAAFIDTMTGGLVTLNLPGQIASVGRSADGRFYGFVFINPANGQRDNRIAVYDAQTDQSRSYELRSPVDDGKATNSILYADALDFTADGALLVYDAVNRVRDQFGFFRDSYSIYFLERTSGAVFALAAPDARYNVGNPAIGQIHNNYITFEADDSATQTSYVIAKDMASGKVGQIGSVSSVNGVAFPGYSGGDDAVIYSDPDSGAIGFRPVGTDGVTPSAPGSYLIGGHIGVIYRRGSYVSIPTLTLTLAEGNAAEAGSAPGSVEVARTGGDGAAIPFSIVITGTAGNSTDFNQLAFNFTLPAGVQNAGIVVTPIDDSLTEGVETVTLTLQDGVNYRAGASVAGTISIADNDAANAYDVWLRAAFGEAVVSNPALMESTWGPDADPDKDGLTNLAEAYFGADPKVPSRMELTAARAADGDLLLRWTESEDAKGLTAAPEWSGDLGAWLKSGETAGGIPARAITVSPVAGAPGKQKEAKLPSAGLTRAALRLRISR